MLRSGHLDVEFCGLDHYIAPGALCFDLILVVHLVSLPTGICKAFSLIAFSSNEY